jgi:hypothetical protein
VKEDLVVCKEAMPLKQTRRRTVSTQIGVVSLLKRYVNWGNLKFLSIIPVYFSCIFKIFNFSKFSNSSISSNFSIILIV